MSGIFADGRDACQQRRFYFISSLVRFLPFRFVSQAFLDHALLEGNDLYTSVACANSKNKTIQRRRREASFWITFDMAGCERQPLDLRLENGCGRLIEERVCISLVVAATMTRR